MRVEDAIGAGTILLAALILWTIFGGSRKALLPFALIISVLYICAAALTIAKELIAK